MNDKFLLLSETGSVEIEGLSGQGNSFMDDLSPFMALQKCKGYQPIKFVEVFPAAKIADPEKFIFFMSTKDPWVGVEFSYRKKWVLFGWAAVLNLRAALDVSKSSSFSR